MKKYLENLIAKLEGRKATIQGNLDNLTAENVAEARSMYAELQTIDADLAEARAQLAALPEEDVPPAANTNQRNGLNVLQMGTNPDQRGNEVPVLESREYQEAFMNFVARGTAIPTDLQARAAAVTTVADGGIMVPTTVLKEIIKQLDAHGELYRRVRKLNVQGGVEIPILTVKPTAQWVGEGASEDQKAAATEKISFSYFGIEVKIAQTLLANVVTLDAFNNMFIQLAVEAIIAEIERCIISGDGNGKLLGVTKDKRVPEANKITMTDAEMGSWASWKQKVFARMKKAYRNGIFIMAQGTFDANIDGMVDSVGQPVGRVNYGITGGETYRFGGKEVLTVEDDVIVPYDQAVEGDVIAVFMKPTDFGINSNMAMTTTKWTDHDTNQVKTKVQMVCDGKMIDVNGVLLILKGAEVVEDQVEG